MEGVERRSLAVPSEWVGVVGFRRREVVARSPFEQELVGFKIDLLEHRIDNPAILAAPVAKTRKIGFLLGVDGQQDCVVVRDLELVQIAMEILSNSIEFPRNIVRAIQHVVFSLSHRCRFLTGPECDVLLPLVILLAHVQRGSKFLRRPDQTAACV